MRVAVISCWKYRDCWQPFFRLFERFFPGRQATLITDYSVGNELGDKFDIYHATSRTWCGMLAEYAALAPESVLVFQEDFLLNAPVRQDVISRAIGLLNQGVGMVRLYPCPGPDEDSELDGNFGVVRRGSKYRVSCQTSLWKPEFLHAIASQCGDTPSDFEIRGTTIAESLPDEVLAWKRESEPWPLSYLCSGITRSLWNPASKKLCDLYGIEVDWSMRGFQPT